MTRLSIVDLASNLLWDVCWLLYRRHLSRDCAGVPETTGTRVRQAPEKGIYLLPGQANQDDSSSETQPSSSGKTGVDNADHERFHTGTHERRRAFSPSTLQQAIRAAIHVVQFGVAYFVMLLAMYYNGKSTAFCNTAFWKQKHRLTLHTGYFLICIITGAFIGSFIFSWDQATFM